VIFRNISMPTMVTSRHVPSGLPDLGALRNRAGLDAAGDDGATALDREDVLDGQPEAGAGPCAELRVGHPGLFEQVLRIETVGALTPEQCHGG
jgi:hypothetical protein